MDVIETLYLIEILFCVVGKKIFEFLFHVERHVQRALPSLVEQLNQLQLDQKGLSGARRPLHYALLEFRSVLQLQLSGS